MGISLANESVFALGETPRHVPPRRGGKRLHKATAFRWAKHGLRGVRLETLQVGGTLCTSAEALQRFFEALSLAAAGRSPPDDSVAPAARRLAAERVDRELRRRGL